MIVILIFLCSTNSPSRPLSDTQTEKTPAPAMLTVEVRLSESVALHTRAAEMLHCPGALKATATYGEA
jgi:hypothetical protein